jgi:hypothetical protein
MNGDKLINHGKGEKEETDRITTKTSCNNNFNRTVWTSSRMSSFLERFVLSGTRSAASQRIRSDLSGNKGSPDSCG